MIQTSLTIEVEVLYDVDDAETISVDITAYGKCKQIDNSGGLERYSVELLWESLRWDTDDFSTTANKAIRNHLENNKREIGSVLTTKIIEQYTDKPKKPKP
jgi:hypothetical protein